MTTSMLLCTHCGIQIQIKKKKKERVYETVPMLDGSAVVHTMVHCMLADMVCMVNLHVEDAAFVLNECGLLVQRDGEGNVMTIVIL